MMKFLYAVLWIILLYGYFFRHEREISKINIIILRVIKLMLVIFPVLVIISVSSFLLINRYPLTPELRAELVAKKKVVKLNPDDVIAHFDLLVTCGYTNRLLKGYGEYRKVLKMDPSLGFGERVVRKYQLMVEKDPLDWKSRFRLVVGLYAVGKNKEGIKQIEEVNKIDPSNVWAYVCTGLGYASMGDWVKAVESLEKARDVNPKIAVVHLGLGNGYAKVGREKESIRAFVRGIWLAICGR